MALLLQFVTLVVFAFGAPAFTVLALSYWRQKRKGSIVFRTFTVLCAVLFIANLTSTVFFIDYAAVIVARSVLVSLLPAIMFHLVLEREFSERVPLAWRSVRWSLYALVLLSDLATLTHWKTSFNASPQLLLGFASILALILLFTQLRHRPADHQWTWNVLVFSALLSSAVMAAVSDNPFFDLAPDYFVLLFFSIQLYYTERLAFFDTFMRGGTFFALGAMLIASVLLLAPPFHSSFGNDWTQAWVGILALIPFWLVAPFLYAHMGALVDYALDRKYSPAEAERLFMQAVQASNNEVQLREVATQQLSELFRTAAQVEFQGSPVAADDELITSVGACGFVRLSARANQLPFLSADRRLLTSLTTSLSVVLQNVRLRTEQQDRIHREQELATLATKAELRALRAQIDPHFLFNALNAVAGWIRTEPEFADETLAQLAEVFRYTLHRSQNEWALVREEVEFLESYLAVERARFRNRLEVEIMIDPQTRDIKIPAMMIQPLIENAIKHGVSQKSTVGKLRLSVALTEQTVRIEVTDNGPGFAEGFTLESSHAGHGLMNVQHRLRRYYGEQRLLSWDRFAENTVVTLEFPRTDLA